MLLQTLPLVAMIFVIGFGLLTSQLVAVRHSIQQASTRDLGLAVDGAVIDVTRVIAGYVRDNGTTEGPWKSPTEQSPKTSTCAAEAPNQVCLYTTYRWRFTGASSSTSLRGVPAGQSKAVNLQKALIDEQRVSVQIIAILITAKGDVLGKRARDVTLRIFNATPYAIPVGSYDVASELGSAGATQGDTGGNKQPLHDRFIYTKPDSEEPQNYRDTTIHVALTCQNSLQNSDQRNPTQDNHAGYDGQDASNLPWGQRDFAYETPCAPTYTLDPPPSGAPPYPSHQNYTLAEPPSISETWRNNEHTSDTWAP